MGRNKMRALVLRMFQKEKRIWELKAMDGNEAAGGYLETVRAAETLFRAETSRRKGKDWYYVRKICGPRDGELSGQGRETLRF